MAHRPALRIVSWLLILALVGACGVGAVKETTFVYGAMGPDGGTVEIPGVKLVLPAGALAGPTTIAIIPETNPLPILAPVGDPCEYTLLGPQHCCGPVGLALLEDALLTVGYDEALLPDGVTEDDLVLLLWDEGLGALVPAGAIADLDVLLNQFDVDTYDVLGHLAVGIQSCPQPGIAFLGFNNQVLPKAGDASTAANEPSGLWMVSADGTTLPLQLPTDSLVPQSFLPSPDGRTVMYEFWDFQGEVAGSTLYAVGVEDVLPSLLAGDDETIDGYGPTLGWMRDGQRVFFPERIFGDPDVASFSTVPGDASAAPVSLHVVGENAGIEDVRQSLDGNLVMIAYYNRFEALMIDVIQASNGLPVSVEVIPYGGGNNTPRFLPDSSGLYLVDSDREAVDRYDPDGSNPTTLFTPPVAHGSLKDFVLAPNGDDYAYVARQTVADVMSTAAAVPGLDALYLGSLSGGLREVVNLGLNTFYEELIFHPNGQHVLLDTYLTGVMMFAASNGLAAPELFVDGISELDISADDGRLLLVLRSGQSTTPGDSIGQVTLPPPGLYVTDPDGQNLQPVATPADLDVIEARWLRTVRRAPCMRGSNCFR